MPILLWVITEFCICVLSPISDPVILVAGVHGVAQSLAATVTGFARFHPDVSLAGVIGNRGGSRARHRLPDIRSVHAWLGVHP